MRALIIAILLVFTAQPTVSGALEAPKVFMFIRDGSRDLDLMLQLEVGVMLRMIEEAGFTVDVATASGEAMVTDSVAVTPTVSLDQIDIADYVGVILPCMAPAEDFPMPAKVDALVKEAVELGLPIAAARGSVVTLAKAGGLVDRHYAFAREPDLSERPEFRDAEFDNVSVVRSAGMSTSAICPLSAKSTGRPDGTRHLTQVFIESLGAGESS
jgi:putative intracellular protease/amidase